MKKKLKITLVILLLLLSVGIGSYYFILSQYEPSESLYQFLIPKNAELLIKRNDAVTYYWSRASEENGIPFDYELVLKKNGWSKGEREGASVFYTKDDKMIDLISTTERLDIIKVH